MNPTVRKGTSLSLALPIAAVLHCADVADIDVDPHSSRVEVDASVDSAAVYLARGRRLMKAQDHAGALQPLRQAVRLDPNSPVAHNLLGLTYAFRHKPGLAVDHFERAIALEPDHGDYYMHKGFALMQLTDYDGARDAYERAISLGVYNPKPHLDLGAISEKENDLVEARMHYERVLEKRPHFATAHFRLGLIAEKTGDAMVAMERYAKALKYNPDLTGAHYRVAQLYFEAGRTTLAEIHVERFRDLKALENTRGSARR